MFGILCDYLNNGIYSNEREIININGSTDFLWQKTIDETYPIIELTADKKRDLYYLSYKHFLDNIKISFSDVKNYL